MKFCAYPNNRALKIAEKFPKSMQCLQDFLKKYLRPDNSKESAEMAEVVMSSVGNIALFVLFSDARKLYDFFDDKSIWINVYPALGTTLFTAAIDQEHSGYFTPEVHIYNADLSIRANAELTAFEKAFELLEEKLNS